MKDIFNTILVVLYKTKPDESSTLRSIIEYLNTLSDSRLRNYKIILWDNTPDIDFSEEYLHSYFGNKLSFEYINTPENTSLSVIYNSVIDTIPDESYINLFDQDSELPTSYFLALNDAQKIREPLILPRVICNGKLVSPGKRFFARGRLLSTIDFGPVRSKNLIAINSGMSIHKSVFKNIRYDQQLRFYGTDTFFMKKYEKYNTHVYILNSSIEHSLAAMTNQTYEWYKNYQVELLRILPLIFNDSIIDKLFVKIFSFYYRVKNIYLKY